MKIEKRSYSIVLASTFLILFFILVSSTADAVDIWKREEIRGQVSTGDFTWTANNFAGFYYNINNDVSTESLTVTDLNGGNVIPAGGLTYTTQIKRVDYEHRNWGQYPIIGFFGENWVPINPNRADKIAKLVLDSDDKHTIRTGEQLDLGNGYTLEAVQVDVDGQAVWFRFNKDGEFVDDNIISVGTGTSTWEVELDDIEDQDNVVVLRVHVNQVFQGAVDSIAQIQGIWLIDYANAMNIESDEEFGALNDVSINGDTLVITNEDFFTLIGDSYQEIGQGMYFRVADTASNVLRFYVTKELREPGTYEIRGQVASGTGDFRWNITNFAGFHYDLGDNIETETLAVSGLNGNVIPAGDFIWTANNFAGFYYNINNDVSTESLAVSGLNGNVIPAGGLTYTTQIKKVDYNYWNWGQYPIIGFFAENWVPINPDRADKIAKLVLDSDDKHTIRTGEQLDLGNGYTLEAKQIDVAAQAVWLEFKKDGQYVDDEIISTNYGDPTWTCTVDNIQGVNNVPVLKVHVYQVIQGAVDSIAMIDGLWLIGYANAMTIDSNSEFGHLDKVKINGATLNITNEDTFTLTRDADVEIGQGMFFKICDTPVGDFRYYPYVERTTDNDINPPYSLPPVAKFSCNATEGNAPLYVQFTDMSENAVSWKWDFENDEIPDIIRTNEECGVTVDPNLVNYDYKTPVYRYTAPGNYTAKLTVTNEGGMENSMLAKITVKDETIEESYEEVDAVEESYEEVDTGQDEEATGAEGDDEPIV